MVTQLFRLLELVRRELGAEDVRAEVGGRDPVDPRLVYCALTEGWRLVAVFGEVPDDREGLAARLVAIAKTFSGLAPDAPEWLSPSGELAARRLDDELGVLADRAGAIRALVIDATSPVIWGSSGPRRVDEDVEHALATAAALAVADSAGIDSPSLPEQDAANVRTALDRAGIDARTATLLARELERFRDDRRSVAAWRNHSSICRAIAAVRETEPHATGALSSSFELIHERGWAHLARSFANIYCLLLVFEEGASELHAQAAVVHASPVIEKLVLALPPVEPPPRQGKLMRLQRPKG